MSEDCADAGQLSACGDPGERRQLLAKIFEEHRRRLRLLVELRLDPRLRPRIDPSDVLQDAYLEAVGRLDEYLRDPPMPLFIWLRRLTGQKLDDLHARHLGAEKRSARREVRLDRSEMPLASSAVLAARIAARGSSPSEAASRDETLARLREVLDAIDPLDREALALRFYEGLSGPEVAAALGIGKGAARMRYFRALKRLREALGSDLIEELP